MYVMLKAQILLSVIHVVPILLRNVEIYLIRSNSLPLLGLTTLEKVLQRIRQRSLSLRIIICNSILSSHGHERNKGFSHHSLELLYGRLATNGRRFRLVERLGNPGQLLFLYLILQRKELIPQAGNSPGRRSDRRLLHTSENNYRRLEVPWENNSLPENLTYTKRFRTLGTYTCGTLGKARKD
jgi:hypothetical protein